MTKKLKCDSPILPCVLLLLLGFGCGRNDANRGAITGQVKIDGKLLAEGSILFAPIEGTEGVVTGGPIKDGRYQLSRTNGPATGWNRVEIQGMRATGRKIQKPLAPQVEMVDEYEAIVPARFNSQSTLKVEVKPGDNTADFDVATK